MLCVRRGFIRFAAVAAAGAACLAVSACGGSVSSGPSGAVASAAPSSSSALEPVLSMGGETMFASGATSGPGGVADPLRNLSGEQVYAEAVDDADAAPSTTYVMKETESGASYVVTLVIVPNDDCAVTIEQGGAEVEELLVLGKTIYVKLTAKFFTTPLDRVSAADAATIMALADGKWIRLTPNSTNTAALTETATVCDAFHRFKDGIAGTTYTKGAVTTLDGVRVVPVEASVGGAYEGTYYVSDTAKPEFVEEAGGDAAEGLGTVAIKVGAPVTVTTPPASQVINGSSVGL